MVSRNFIAFLQVKIGQADLHADVRCAPARMPQDVGGTASARDYSGNVRYSERRRMMPTIDEWFARYGESHRNPVNKALHWVCVPAITWSVIAIAWWLSPYAALALCALALGVLRVPVAADRPRHAGASSR